jgi:hypothetical protein
MLRRSPYFQALFRNDCRESQTCHMDIQDVASEFIRCALLCLYGAPCSKLLDCLLHSAYIEQKGIKASDDMPQSYNAYVDNMVRTTMTLSEAKFACAMLSRVLGIYIVLDRYQIEGLQHALRDIVFDLARMAWRHPDVLQPLHLIYNDLPVSSMSKDTTTTICEWFLKEVRARIDLLRNEPLFINLLDGNASLSRQLLFACLEDPPLKAELRVFCIWCFKSTPIWSHSAKQVCAGCWSDDFLSLLDSRRHRLWPHLVTEALLDQES